MQFGKDMVLRLLVVDDSVEAAEAIVSGLRNGGIAVRPSRPESEDELAQLVQQQAFELVLASHDARGIPLDRVMAVVEPVLGLVRAAAEIMVGQQIVEAKLASDHFGQPTRRDPDMAAAFALFGIERRKIFARQPGQILRIDQMPGLKAAFVPEFFHRIRLEAPAFVFGQPGRASGNSFPARGVSPGIEWRLPVLRLIAMGVADDLVAVAVVQRQREWQDMIDIHAVGKKRIDPDRLAAIGAWTRQYIIGIQFLP